MRAQLIVSCLLCVSVNFITPFARPGFCASARRYIIMPKDRARAIVIKAVEDDVIPHPGGSSFSSWELPSVGELHASGVQIDKTDYVVFAAVGGKLRTYLPQTNLADLLPNLSRMPYYDKAVGRSEKGETLVGFRTNGILVSTIDCEVVDRSVFSRGGDSWKRGKRVLKKGAYTWSLGPVGVLLQKKGGDELLLPLQGSYQFQGFEEFSEDFVILSTLSLAPGEGKGILIDVPGDDLHFK